MSLREKLGRRRSADRAHGPGIPRSALVHTSPMRRVDPRVKLLVCLCASAGVMLPLNRMLLFIGLYAGLVIWARLVRVAARQLWRIRWLLAALFVMDTLFISVDLAVVITLRLVLLTTVFALLVSTTTPEELRMALERLRVPYRYAFSLSLAFQSVDLMGREWHAIREAQMARGAWIWDRLRWRDLVRGLGSWVALTVPAIVLTTHRAWAMTEAAHARGFGSPCRQPYKTLEMHATDWALLCGAVIIVSLLLFAGR